MKHRTNNKATLASMTILLLLTLVTFAGCSPGTGAPPAPQLAEELTFLDWGDDKIADTFAGFTERYGVKINYLTFESTEEAVERIEAGEQFDVVVIENQYLPRLAEAGLLAEIEYGSVPNFKHISPNFRNLGYDPENRYSIPYSWGTTGLVVRSDLVSEPITSWGDLWNPAYKGKAAVWAATPRYVLGAALMNLGYSVNSENPAELEEAAQLLKEHKQDLIIMSEDLHSSAELLASGEITMALGWSEDLWLTQEHTDAVEFIIPSEGAILWGDSFVIPANTVDKHTAELFLDYLLQPEISAVAINGNYYPMANESAKQYVDPAILNDPVVFPTNDDMRNAQILLPLSAAADDRYAQLWDQFLSSEQ